MKTKLANLAAIPLSLAAGAASAANELDSFETAATGFINGELNDTYLTVAIAMVTFILVVVGVGWVLRAIRGRNS